MNQDTSDGEKNPRNEYPSTPQWSNQPSPSLGYTSPEAPPPPKKSKRRIVIIIASLVVLSIALFVFIYSKSTSCFDSSSYASLLDVIRTVDSDTVETTDVQPNVLLYTHYVYYEHGGTKFDAESDSGDPTTFLQSIGTYYQSNYTSAPIAIKLSTNYTEASSRTLAQERLNHIRDILIQAGLNASTLTVSQPNFIQLSDDSFEDDDVQGEIPMLVSITPTSRCED